MPRTSAKSKKRSSEEAASFNLGHRYRVEILSALGEGDYSQSELARLLRLPESTVQHHLRGLLAARAIEVAEIRQKRGHDQNLYRALKTAYYGEAEMATWSFEKRQAFWGLIIQNSGAEALAALYNGTISGDQKSWLTWARFNVDQQGWQEMFKVFSDAWQRLVQIEVQSKARQEETGEKLRTVIANLQGYPRSRPGRSSYPDRSSSS